jgi:hypothetical protein
MGEKMCRGSSLVSTCCQVTQVIDTDEHWGIDLHVQVLLRCSKREEWAYLHLDVWYIGRLERLDIVIGGDRLGAV